MSWMTEHSEYHINTHGGRCSLCGLMIFLRCIYGSYSPRGFFLVMVVMMVVMISIYYMPGILLNAFHPFSLNLTTYSCKVDYFTLEEIREVDRFVQSHTAA